MKLRYLLLSALLLSVQHIEAQPHTYTFRLYFVLNQPRSGTEIDSTNPLNQASLQQLNAFIQQLNAGDTYCLQSVQYQGNSSPDGELLSNRLLAMRRANALRHYVTERLLLPQEETHRRWRCSAWSEVANPLESQPLFTTHTPRASHYNPAAFARLRYAEVTFTVLPQCDRQLAPLPAVAPPHREVRNPLAPPLQRPLLATSEARWALKTNLLYDALMIPNIGVEVDLSHRWSLSANWMYAWWRFGRVHFWRIYGGEVTLRRWFGRQAHQKHLSGHHIGWATQLFTYDFEWGGRGYQSHLSYITGIEYGYSLPISRSLHLDFTLAAGYWGGLYKEYLPIDCCYVWQNTKRRHWIGPIKAEVTLVWLLYPRK